VIALWEAARPGDGMAIAAVGGYGRRRLVPGSDLDILLVYRPGLQDEAARVVDAVLYPLWDQGVHASHAVRTPAECRDEARTSLESLTAMLDTRHLAGDERLSDAARSAAEEAVEHDRAAFVARLSASRAEREERFGVLAHGLEPDLKESLGGLRDAAIPGWLGLPGAAQDEPFLLSVRTALHQVSGGRSDRLTSDLQAAVAERVGVTDEEGWEARDRLLQRVGEAGARIDLRVSGLLAPVGIEDRSDPARSFLAGSNEDGVWATAARDAFVSLLASGRPGGRALAELTATGALQRVLPGWADVAGRPQRDPYHRFPVHAHLLSAAVTAAELLREPDEPFVAQAVRVVNGLPDGIQTLLLGSLLHDIGKVGRGSHVEAGVERTAAVLERLGVEPAVRETVTFLVREHLLLSDTATRKNLEDEDLVLHVAARVGDPARLALLYLLTVADAEATGPSAVTPWRMGLVRDLVAKVQRAFEQGLMDRDRADQLREAEAGLRAALGRADPSVAEWFVGSAPPAYLLWADAADGPKHLRLVSPPPGADEVRTFVRPGRTPDTYALGVGAADRPGLLANIAGALTLSGLSILTAQAFTLEPGVALDVFELRGAFEAEVSDERWRRFREHLRRALAGRTDLRTKVRELRSHYRQPRTRLEVRVRVDIDSSDYHTVVEVSAADRLGLLFDLATAFAEQRLDVHLAKVATYGARVVDSFYVTEVGGEKLADPSRVDAVRVALSAAARG
jgi:[protein-PII] uridylyltransferase